MKSLLLIVACVCISQVNSGEIMNKYYRIPSWWTGQSEDEIEQYRTKFNSIKDINSGTLNDIMDVLREFRQNFAVIKFFQGVNEVLGKDLGARESVLTLSGVEPFFVEAKKGKEIYQTNDIVTLLNEIEQTFSEKLTPDQVTRIMTLVRIYEGTPKAIENGLNYLYTGSTVHTAST